MQNKELGFNKEQLLIIDATDTPQNTTRLVLKNELKNFTKVLPEEYRLALLRLEKEQAIS